jgi:hypothetical protein
VFKAQDRLVWQLCMSTPAGLPAYGASLSSNWFFFISAFFTARPASWRRPFPGVSQLRPWGGPLDFRPETGGEGADEGRRGRRQGGVAGFEAEVAGEVVLVVPGPEAQLLDGGAIITTPVLIQPAEPRPRVETLP